MQFEERESAFMITPRELLETSIAQLKTLAAFLSDQLADAADGVAFETRACKEILRAVSGLIDSHQGSCAPVGGHGREQRSTRETCRLVG